MSRHNADRNDTTQNKLIPNEKISIQQVKVKDTHSWKHFTQQPFCVQWKCRTKTIGNGDRSLNNHVQLYCVETIPARLNVKYAPPFFIQPPLYTLFV